MQEAVPSLDKLKSRRCPSMAHRSLELNQLRAFWFETQSDAVIRDPYLGAVVVVALAVAGGLAVLATKAGFRHRGRAGGGGATSRKEHPRERSKPEGGGLMLGERRLGGSSCISGRRVWRGSLRLP